MMGMWGRGGIAWPWDGRGYSWAKRAQSDCGAEGGGHTVALGHCGAKGAVKGLEQGCGAGKGMGWLWDGGGTGWL